MVLPLNTGDELQQMKRITKTQEGISEETFHNFSFVPMLKGKSN
jgi:protein-L-isoaspartate O-methyltransferase